MDTVYIAPSIPVPVAFAKSDIAVSGDAMQKFYHNEESKD